MLGVAALGFGLLVPATASATVKACPGAYTSPTYLVPGTGVNAISRMQVVGNAGAAGSGTYHAFAYGLRTKKSVDLGTLGGFDSDATATYDNIVAGWAYTATPAQSRAFVVTMPGTTQMVDIGTLGGGNSAASAVTADFVVGWANTAGNAAAHAFRYRIATKKMTDLGTLGGRDSTPTAIDLPAYGNTIVGYADTAGGTMGDITYHAFADSGTAMTDLGTLGGTNSDAVAVNQHIVVGWAQTAAGSLHAFYDDLTHPRMVDLGTLGGTDSEARAVYGDYVVGYYDRADSTQIPFIYNIRTHTMKSLGAFRGSPVNMVTGMGRSIVSGFSYIPVAQRFVPWAYNVSTGKYIALPTTLHSPAGYPAPTAGVNTDNDIAGTGVNSAGIFRATLWNWRR
jgi:probable HAF family extracellular repeat protein